MSYAESDLLPLSGVQHLIFCERQASLIFVENQWADNVLTVDGVLRHLTVHEEAPRKEKRGAVMIVRGLPLRSMALGLVGIADVVEFHRCSARDQGASLPGLGGRWRPFPVEYKRGKPKPHRADEVQLCAQALCLEEMLGCPVLSGSLFYGSTQRRMPVDFDEQLRALATDAAKRLHYLVETGTTAPPRVGPHCRNCSLVDLCLPTAVSGAGLVARYLRGALSEAFEEEG